MKKYILLLFLFQTMGFVIFAQSKLPQATYEQQSFILKVHPQYAAFCSEDAINIPGIQERLALLDVESLRKIYPHHHSPKEKYNKWGFELVDLSTIYCVNYLRNIPIEIALAYFNAIDEVEYAEYIYIEELFYVPNDPLTASQYHLNNIKAYDAWDIWQGDTAIVVGIVDTGSDLDHPDLEDALAYNYADPLDGIDNDNDGYIDNYYGWDLGEGNNNPQVNAHVHGSHVAGISSAVGDNTVGIIGSGFKCRYLPIKIDNVAGSLVYGYEGIVYAADHGCSVINCSWGSTNSYSRYGEDIVNYATHNRNALVVAACGNSNNEYIYYPASYQYVLSVAATNSNDEKWTETTNGSTYNYKVDISAPGQNIFSTINGGAYVISSGTSMASPMVAGAAALLMSYYANQNWHAWQFAERLKATADGIDTIPFNIPFAAKMGSGRLNMYRALTDSLTPGIKTLALRYTDKDDDIFERGDSLFISADFINYLDTTQDLDIIISTNSPYVELNDTVFNAGVISAMQTMNNDSSPFSLKILQDMPYSYDLVFTLAYVDSSQNYYKEEFFRKSLNVDYLNIDTNNINATISSKSLIGYNDLPLASQGNGLIFNDYYPMLYYGGFIIGNAAASVSDNLYGMLGNFESDFYSLENIKKLDNPSKGDQMYAGVFCDSANIVSPLFVNVSQLIYAWDDTERENYIISEYRIRNDGSNDLNNIYAGLYMDWDIINSAMNIAKTVSSHRLGYVCFNNLQYYGAVQLLNDTVFNHYAIDNDGTNASISINDGFSGFDKFICLSSQRNEAGVQQGGNDVSQLLSSGPYTIAAGDSITLAFAIHTALNYTDLIASAEVAYNTYHGIQNIAKRKFTDYKLYPNAAKDVVFVESASFSSYNSLPFSIYDMKGQLVLQNQQRVEANKLRIPLNSLKNGIYLLKMEWEEININHKIIVIN